MAALQQAPWEATRESRGMVYPKPVWIIVQAGRTICRLFKGSDDEGTARMIAAAPEMLSVLLGMNHMGGDERGGYCICPCNDGSAADQKHATVCVDARRAIAKANGQ